MFKGFDLRRFDLSFFKPEYQEELQVHGKSVTTANQTAVRKLLETIANTKAALDGAKLQDTWFPQVKANVFISHSRRNENLAMALAGWLNDRFGLVAFVDSAIWDYAGDLLRIIDNVYCWQDESQELYSYQKRNESTSHVHMMLVTAIGMMIHRTECLLFVNTPQSISSQDVVAKTYSPWIYAELTMAAIVEEIEPDRLKNRTVKLAAAGKINESREWAGVLHEIKDLSRLKQITPDTLIAWQDACKVTGEEALDVLYNVVAKG